MKHVFELNDMGETNEFAYDEGNHNGPRCILCGKSGCQHCSKWTEQKCKATLHQIERALDERVEKMVIINKEIQMIEKVRMEINNS